MPPRRWPEAQAPGAIDAKLHRGQPVTAAWARNAETILDLKQGPVGRAHDVRALGVEKPIRHPIERCADVRTGVHVGIDESALAHGEKLESLICAMGDTKP